MEIDHDFFNDHSPLSLILDSRRAFVNYCKSMYTKYRLTTCRVQQEKGQLPKKSVGGLTEELNMTFPVSILRKSISGRHRPVRVADGPMTARCRFT